MVLECRSEKVPARGNLHGRNAVLAHLNGPVVEELLPKLLGTASVTGSEVYGNPGPKATERLAAFGAEIFEFQYGRNR
jgi:hypothetical protein